jgi:GTP-binding protein HflX
VLVDDSLFATLDPTVRKVRTPGGRDITVSDTVGFVRHLPHELVEAFRSTLEEIRDADVIVHVVDGSDEVPREQIAAVREVLSQIDAGDVPEIIAINKADVAEQNVTAEVLRHEPHAVLVSARSGLGIGELLAAIDADLPRTLVDVDVVVPYERGDLLARVYREGDVVSVDHEEHGSHLKARVAEELARELDSVAAG